MDCGRPAQRLGTDLGQADMADPALVDAFDERADRLLDRHLRIEPRGAVDVDRLDPQPLQRVGEEILDRRGSAVEAGPAARGIAQRVELDAEHIAVARDALERLADQHFVVAHAVEVAGIDQGDSRIERSVNCGDALCAIGWSVHTRHAHAAKAERGNGGAGSSEATLLHDRFLVLRFG